jgi:segregation and condensation protein B
MGRVEAVVFASREPVTRETLARLVGKDCRLDELMADIQNELSERPYELAFVAGGWQLRTRPRFAAAIHLAGVAQYEGAERLELTKTETLVMASIAFFQPVTRKRLSNILGRDIGRDIISRLKRLGLIGAGPRSPESGAPLTYVTTPSFLTAFGLASLRDLPDIETLEDAALFQRGPGVEDPISLHDEMDSMFGQANAYLADGGEPTDPEE